MLRRRRGNAHKRRRRMGDSRRLSGGHLFRSERGDRTGVLTDFSGAGKQKRRHFCRRRKSNGPRMGHCCIPLRIPPSGYNGCVMQVSWLALRKNSTAPFLPSRIAPVANFRPMTAHFGWRLALTVPVAWVLTPFILSPMPFLRQRTTGHIIFNSNKKGYGASKIEYHHNHS